MRYKSLVEPRNVQKGDEWLSPDGYSSTWRRVWNGTAWVEDLKAAGFPATQPAPINPNLSNVGTDEDDDTEDDEDDTEEPLDERDDMEEEQPKSTEGQSSEQGVQTEVSDSDREQGTGGKLEPEPKQRGKRGKVRKGGKG